MSLKRRLLKEEKRRKVPREVQNVVVAKNDEFKVTD